MEIVWNLDNCVSSTLGCSSYFLNVDRIRQNYDNFPALVSDDDPRFLLTAGPQVRAWWAHLDRSPSVVPVFPFRGRVFVGPELGLDLLVCPTCFFLRLAQCFPHTGLVPTVFFEEPRISSGKASSLTAVLMAAIQGASFSNDGVCSSFDVSRAGIPSGRTEHRVLKVPGSHPRHDLAERFESLCPELPTDGEGKPTLARFQATQRNSIVDRYVGPIVDVCTARKSDEAPETLVGRVATAGFLGNVVSWKPDVTGSGLYYNESTAKSAAIGEAAERYCGNYVHTDRIVQSSAAELRKVRHSRILTPLDFGGWDVVPTFENGNFRPFEPTSEEDWVGMTCPNRGLEVMAPAEAVLLNYTRHSNRRAQFPVQLAGIAAGSTFKNACSSAYLELLERDATMRWWHGCGTSQQILDLPADVERDICPKDGYAIEHMHILLPTRSQGAVCTASLVHDLDKQIIVLGFAARTDLASAIRKSSAEAWQLHLLSTQLLDSKSHVWQHIRANKLPIPTLAFRQDRSYASLVNQEWHTMDQLAYNLQYYLDPEVQDEARGRVQPSDSIVFSDASLLSEPSLSGWDLLADSPTAAVVELSTPDFVEHGFHVSRVIDTELVGNFATAFVPWWHASLSGTVRRFDPIPHA